MEATHMTTAGRASLPSSVPTMRVRTPDGRVLRFTEPFHIGRGEECEVRVDDVHVSRRHLLVSFENGSWGFRDLRSANGVFADGHRLGAAAISRSLAITLGRDGPTLTLEVERASRLADASDAELEVPAHNRETMVLEDDVDVAKHYFEADDRPQGRRTMMIRKAFQRVQKKQRRRYAWIVASLSVAAIALPRAAMRSTPIANWSSSVWRSRRCSIKSRRSTWTSRASK
jgi:hypothetical protein